MAIVVSLLVGIALGAVFGVLIAPAVHLWVGRGEWREAAREIALAVQLLEQLDDGAETFDESVARGTTRTETGPSTQLHGRGH